MSLSNCKEASLDEHLIDLNDLQSLEHVITEVSMLSTQANTQVKIKQQLVSLLHDPTNICHKTFLQHFLYIPSKVMSRKNSTPKHF